MAWTTDKNGKQVFVGDAQNPLLFGQGGVAKVSIPTRRANDIERERAAQEDAGSWAEGAQDPQTRPVDEFPVIPFTRSQFVPDLNPPRFTPTARPTSMAAPYAESRAFPDVTRPVALPPETVEATRLVVH